MLLSRIELSVSSQVVSQLSEGTMTEEEFTKTIIIPMLHHIGYRRIRYVHGIDEHGRDLLFFDQDRFGQETLQAAQVKLGNLKGSQKQKIQIEIAPQLQEGLRMPYRDPETGKTHQVSRMYLIISGEYLGTAKDQIHTILSDNPNIVALDRQTIDLLVTREGVETLFGVCTEKEEYMISCGNESGLPRLPLLSKGVSLEISVDLSEYDFYTECFEVQSVSYNPVFKNQTVYLAIDDQYKEIGSILIAEIYSSLKESSSFLWELWEGL